jgi:GTP-binding protein
MDGTHPSDHEALEFLRASGRQVVVAVTKMDKLSRNKRAPALRAAEADLGVPKGQAVPFSAVEGTGTDALWDRLAALTRAAEA